MNYIVPHMVAEAINQLGNTFDTHDVEQRLIRNHPVAVSREIIRFDGSDDVLQAFSAQVGRYIDRSFERQIRKTSKIRTPNMGGLLSECQQWERLSNPIVAASESASS